MEKQDRRKRKRQPKQPGHTALLLLHLMTETGMTNQSELARRLNPPEAPTWINNRLSGYSDIHADDIPRIAQALNVPCSRFFDGANCLEFGAPPDAESARAPSPTPYSEFILPPDIPEDAKEFVRAAIRLAMRFYRRPLEEKQAS